MSLRLARPFSASQKLNGLLMAGCAIVVLMIAALPSSARAAENEYKGKELPGKSWTAGNGVFLHQEFDILGWANTTSSVCVGPVTYNGTYHMPYGWACATEKEEWIFTALEAAAGIYNPNPGTFGKYEVKALGK